MCILWPLCCSEASKNKESLHYNFLQLTFIRLRFLTGLCSTPQNTNAQSAGCFIDAGSYLLARSAMLISAHHRCPSAEVAKWTTDWASEWRNWSMVEGWDPGAVITSSCCLTSLPISLALVFPPHPMLILPASPHYFLLLLPQCYHLSHSCWQMQLRVSRGCVYPRFQASWSSMQGEEKNLPTAGSPEVLAASLHAVLQRTVGPDLQNRKH